MKRGFTLIELLVASLLMGMLVTILTMLFNQSSIAWRSGVAGVVDLDEVRQNISAVHEESDNAYVWNNETYRILGLWDDNGQLRERAWSISGNVKDADKIHILKGLIRDQSKLTEFNLVPVGSATAPGSVKTYAVNVKSAGPDKKWGENNGENDDIWSFPDEIQW